MLKKFIKFYVNDCSVGTVLILLGFILGFMTCKMLYFLSSLY
jgi:hypothetical protein